MFKKISVIFGLTLLVLFASCSAKIEPDNASEKSNFDFNNIQVSEEYLESRSLRDSLVESIIFQDYRLGEDEIDSALASYVFLDKKDLEDTVVYKKNRELMASYQIPKYIVGNDIYDVKLSEAENECIKVESFDFYINGTSGFAVVSNDMRLGDIIYYTCADIENKNELKRDLMLEINENIQNIKKEWSDIGQVDILSVLQRGFGFSEDQTRGFSFSGFISGIFGNPIPHYVYGKWNTNSRSNKVLEDYIQRAEISDLLRKILNYGYLCSGADSNLEYSDEKFPDYIDSTIYSDYYPYKGKLFLSSILNDYKQCGDWNFNDTKNLGEYHPGYVYTAAISAMLINEHPVFSYTYKNRSGDKVVINNVWRYIKSFNYQKDDPTLLNRILEHLMYYIISYCDEPSVYNSIRVSNTSRLRDKNLKASSSIREFKSNTFKLDGDKAKTTGLGAVWMNVAEALNKCGYITYRVDFSEYHPDNKKKEFSLFYDSKNGDKTTSKDESYSFYTKYIAPVISNGGFFRDLYGTQMWQDVDKSGRSYQNPRHYIKSYEVSYKVGRKKILDNYVGDSRKYKYKTLLTDDYYCNAYGVGLENLIAIHRKTDSSSQVPSYIRLPLNAKDGRQLVDVLKYGGFEIQPESTAFKKQNKSSSATIAENGTQGAVQDDSAANTKTFIPDPNSTTSTSKDGMCTYVRGSGTGGVRVQVGKKK